MNPLKAVLFLLAVALPVVLATAGCLNHKGEIVDWFVVYTTNANTKYAFPDYGYLYIDSTFTKPGFYHYSGYGNEEDAPIGLTIAQAKDQDLSVLAWNDQLREDQGTGDRYKAHSKFYMAVTSDKSRGFAMSHSVPNYPSFESEQSLIPDINNSQRQKAQHHFCFTIYDAETTKNLYDYGCFINPNIYAKKGFNTCKHWRTSGIFFLTQRFSRDKSSKLDNTLSKPSSKTATLTHNVLPTAHTPTKAKYSNSQSSPCSNPQSSSKLSALLDPKNLSEVELTKSQTPT